MSLALRCDRRRTLYVLPPDQELATGDHNSTANKNATGRKHSPDDAVDPNSPQQRGVLERRHDRRRCNSERLGEQVLSNRGKKADTCEQPPLLIPNWHPVRCG